MPWSLPKQGALENAGGKAFCRRRHGGWGNGVRRACLASVAWVMQSCPQTSVFSLEGRWLEPQGALLSAAAFMGKDCFSEPSPHPPSFLCGRQDQAPTLVTGRGEWGPCWLSQGLYCCC